MSRRKPCHCVNLSRIAQIRSLEFLCSTKETSSIESNVISGIELVQVTLLHSCIQNLFFLLCQQVPKHLIRQRPRRLGIASAVGSWPCRFGLASRIASTFKELFSRLQTARTSPQRPESVDLEGSGHCVEVTISVWQFPLYEGDSVLQVLDISMLPVVPLNVGEIDAVRSLVVHALITMGLFRSVLLISI